MLDRYVALPIILKDYQRFPKWSISRNFVARWWGNIYECVKFIIKFLNLQLLVSISALYLLISEIKKQKHKVNKISPSNSLQLKDLTSQPNYTQYLTIQISSRIVYQPLWLLLALFWPSLHISTRWSRQKEKEIKKQRSWFYNSWSKTFREIRSWHSY